MTARTATKQRKSEAFRRPPGLLRSEGQRLLMAVPGSLSQIAAAVGSSSKATVGDWRMGTKVPGAHFRKRLAAVFGIPERAWETRAGSMVEAAPVSAPRESTREQLDAVLAELRVALEGDLSGAAKRKLTDCLLRAIALRHRMDRDAEALEDKIVRQQPLWARLKGALIKALLPHPEAARAVLDRLTELETT